MNKIFKIAPEQIVELAPGMGACLATDAITVDGNTVGYMYRDYDDEDGFSGWTFLAGTETQEYMDMPDHLEVYDVNTIANYDPAIVPFLDAERGTAFARDEQGEFVEVEYEESEE